MIVLAIDPGPVETALVRYDTASARPIGEHRKLGNESALSLVRGPGFADHLAIEMIASYGMPVGAEVFETCVWIGRFIEAWSPLLHTKVYRREVKLHLCGSARAKDGNVRQALVDRYGGKDVAIGRKAKPGPLYGFAADTWAALGVAVTWADAFAPYAALGAA